MRKVILTFGLISGVIIVALMFATVPLWRNGLLDYANSMLVGYTTMVISLSMVFFGVKSYRDNYLNGIITFGKAAQVGFLITLISSLCYAIGWEFNMMFFMKEFGQKLIAEYPWYANPVLRFGMTLTEILPVGIIITLISAGLLRKKEILPD